MLIIWGPIKPCILGLSEIGAEGQKVQKSKLVTFLAVQDSSIGDLVTHSLSQ